MKLFLGLDVSTTGAKALLINEKGGVVSSATTPLTLSTPHPLWSEQDPRDWWTGMAQSIRQALEQAGVAGSAVTAIGLTGQMHGLVLLDEHGEVLRPAILWNDQRTGAQCDEMRSRLGKEHLIQITGNDALTGFTAPKILWVQQNEPEIYARARHILLPKDYIRYRLTGDYAMDKADGSGTILFDLKTRNWSPEVLAALEIPANWLPPTFEGPAVTGLCQRIGSHRRLDWRRVLLLLEAAATAQPRRLVSAQCNRASSPSRLGTSGVVFASTESPLIEPEGRLHAFCHAVPDCWHFMGVMLSAAGSLQWYRDTLAPGVSFDDLVNEAGDIKAGSEGLFFLPYLTGERTPYPDPLCACRLGRADGPPHPGAHDPCCAGRRGLWDQGQLQV